MKGVWFHCTQVDRGERWTASLRAPMYADEPETPRLCVCPTVAECFASRLFDKGPVYCYRVECGAVRAPRSVWDALITREHWVMHRAQLVLHRTVDDATVRRLAEEPLERCRAGKKSTWRTRVEQLFQASVALGSCRKRAERLWRYMCGLSSPKST